jgi:hypothetical protein
MCAALCRALCGDEKVCDMLCCAAMEALEPIDEAELGGEG